MALSEKEKELYIILYNEKLNIIQEKLSAEKDNIAWMPNSSEHGKLKLEIEWLRKYLKETLDAHVNSLIETLRKVGKNVDDSDFNELYETLKIIVNSRFEDFSKKKKNNIFSSLPESIIEGHIHVLKNELPSLIPKALLPLSKFKIETELLEAETYENAVFASFSFPKDLKIPCEQYLLYFAQFLQDVGINVTPNLKEEAGKVLFSVTPTNDVEALDKIREALAVYLNLPSSPIVYDESFAAMRLHQQIENLQHSQKMAVREIRSAERELRLAQTVIESQDKVIVQKDTLIEQQTKVIEKIISKSIMMDSLANKEELEEIFEGLKIGKSKFLMEQLGVHLNPATALKTVGKKILGKDERKSILGLDEEKN